MQNNVVAKPKMETYPCLSHGKRMNNYSPTSQSLQSQHYARLASPLRFLFFAVVDTLLANPRKLLTHRTPPLGFFVLLALYENLPPP